MTKQVEKIPTLRDFAPSMFLLAITSITLALMMQLMFVQDQRFYMYMMFAGIVCGLFDLSVAWLVFGSGNYWIRLPMIVVLTAVTCFMMSRTFPQSATVWLGALLLRIPCIGLPLLVARFRGAEIVRARDANDQRRGSLQFSLASLMALFTTVAIFLVGGRFAEYSRNDVFLLLVFSLTTIVTLMALLTAWSQNRLTFKISLVIVGSILIGLVPAALNNFESGSAAVIMLLGTQLVTVITSILMLRLLGYRVQRIT